MATSGEESKTLVQRAPAAAGGLLRRIVELGIEGTTGFPGAKAAAAKQLQAKGDRDQAIETLIMHHVALAGAQGFVTNLGGLLTLPVSLPANIAGTAIVQIRMLACLAHLRGYDIDDRRVRSALMLAMLGEEEIHHQISRGRLPTTPLAVATAPVFDPGLDGLISERVIGMLATTLGSRRVALLLARRIPVIGGGVGAVADGWGTHQLSRYAKEEFVDRRAR